MRSIKQFRQCVGAGIVSMAILLLTSCHKEVADPKDAATATPTTAATGEQVLTPAGYMDKSKVHFIPQGHFLSVENGRLKQFEAKTGRLIADWGEANATPAPSKGPVPYVTGWIAYAYWTNTNTSKPITNFTTTWTVPSQPTNKGSQTLFLFNGLQNGTTSSSFIIQPVLQWGSSAAGGGKYWAITNWYVSASNAFYGSLVTVSSGTSLTGVMKQTAVSGSNYSYNSSFTGYSSSSALQVNNVPQVYWAAETLESYGVSTPSTMYPPDADVALKSIQILQGSTNASITWTPVQATSGAAQKAVVVSNASPGGEVDIYFR